MNNIVYDPPRTKEMEGFLKACNKIEKEERWLDWHTIYHLFEEYELKQDDRIPNQSAGVRVWDYFDKWQQEFNRENINKNGFVAFENKANFPGWCQFINKGYSKKEREYIKLYIPVDKKHLYEGARKIFSYMASLRVNHESKIGYKIRSDNVVIRLRPDDYENANKIIDFVTNDSYIKEGLNKINPFVPTCKGIGIMKESGFSYNRAMAIKISEFIENRKDIEKKPTIDEFYDFMAEKYIESLKYLKEIQEKVTMRQMWEDPEKYKMLMEEYQTLDIFNNVIIENHIKNREEKNVQQKDKDTKYIISADSKGRINWVGVRTPDGKMEIEPIQNKQDNNIYVKQLQSINKRCGGDLFTAINKGEIEMVRITVFEDEQRKQMEATQSNMVIETKHKTR